MLFLLVAGQLVAPPPPPPDSIRLRRDAERAQSAFERARRRLLPLTTAGLGRCDVRIGRFCYWYDAAEPPPPPEPPKIAGLRDRLLAILDSLAARSPGGTWIAGQRVRYLVEAGRHAEAVEVTRACGDGWRCSAMAGFALHAERRFVAADSAFGLALAEMSSEQRCRWTDLALLLEPAARGPYQRLGCTARDSANAVLFWLAAPLHTQGGRDLRTEVYARRTLAVMLEGAVTHHGMSAGADYAELLLRYGWATAYGRRHDPLGRPEEIDVVGHEAKPSYAFLAWRPGRKLGDADRPQSRYAPGYLRQLRELDQVQVTRFRRGDTLLVAVGYVAEPDSLFRPDSATGMVVLSTAGGEVTGSVAVRGASAAALVMAPGGAGLLSLELGDRAMGAWRRFRDSVGALPRGLSDLLLFRADSALPARLEEAVGRMSGTVQLRADTPIGLYWETYAAEGDTVLGPVRLTVAPAGEGFFRRVGRAFGAAPDRQRIELEWTPVSARDGAAGQSLELDLSRLRPGRYVIQLEAGGAGRATQEVRLR